MSTAAETIRKHTCSRCLRRQCGGCTAPETCQCSDAGHEFALRRAGQTAERLATCDLCERSFETRNGMLIHRKRAHPVPGARYPDTDTVAVVADEAPPVAEEPATTATPANDGSLDRIVWAVPSATHPKQRLFSEVVEAELRAHPGEWAIVGEVANTTTISGRATRLAKGLTVHGAGWDAKRQRIERDGLASNLYVRWVGEGS